MINKNNTIIDKAQGCLLGLILGDDNGGPTAMMVEVLKSFLIEPKVDIERISSLYLDWFRKDGFDAGLVTYKVLELVDSGLSFDDAAKQVDEELDGMTAGISPAHRSVPLSIIFAKLNLSTPEVWGRCSNAGIRWLRETINQEAKLTHLHDVASEVSQSVNAICMRLMLGDSLDKSLRIGKHFTLNPNNNFRQVDKIKLLSIKDLNNGGYAPDVLVAATWFLLNTDSFGEALKQSKKFAGAANYCPVLVGSIGGAMYGYNEIKPLTKKLNKDKVETIVSSVDAILRAAEK